MKRLTAVMVGFSGSVTLISCNFGRTPSGRGLYDDVVKGVGEGVEVGV